uniref:RRM domain-containing protein n=1 Tax=Calcidiscus leptoporus TaxID=127549 RepID=A0A7S0NN01_9EUKA|mmetsp:Transcript_10483/g.24283  ORF Transcript_10483/g.24283 Transcript_10483/m.24283 type:complete len:204 (+) Transcript_10483:1-612(+)
MGNMGNMGGLMGCSMGGLPVTMPLAQLQSMVGNSLGGATVGTRVLAESGSGGGHGGRNGQPCPTLFVTRMPRSATEETVRALFPNATRVFCSKKPLREGEDRTAYVSFESTEVAMSERLRVNGLQLEQNSVGLHVTFSTKPQDQQGYQSQGSLPSATQQMQSGALQGGGALQQQGMFHDYAFAAGMASGMPSCMGLGMQANDF